MRRSANHNRMTRPARRMSFGRNFPRKGLAPFVLLAAALFAFHGSVMAQDLTVGEEIEQKATQPKPPRGAVTDKRTAAAATLGVVVRVRVTRLSPEQPASIAWRTPKSVS